MKKRHLSIEDIEESYDESRSTDSWTRKKRSPYKKRSFFSEDSGEEKPRKYKKSWRKNKHS